MSAVISHILPEIFFELHCCQTVWVWLQPLWRNWPEFGKIMQNNGHYVVEGHSRSPISVPVKSPCHFLLVNNTSIMYHFEVKNCQFYTHRMRTHCHCDVH